MLRVTVSLRHQDIYSVPPVVQIRFLPTRICWLIFFVRLWRIHYVICTVGGRSVARRFINGVNWMNGGII